MTANFPTGVHILEEIRLFSCFSIFQNRPNSAWEEVILFITGELSFLGSQWFFSRKASVAVTIIGSGVVSVNSVWQSHYAR